MYVADRKEAAHDTCCGKCGETLYVFYCETDHTLRVLLRRVCCGVADGGYADIRAFNGDKIDKYHYISLVSGVGVAHERVWMLCDRYDETRRRARLVNIYTLIVFFCGWQNVIVGQACSEVSALTVSARSMNHQGGGGNRRHGTALTSESVGDFRMMLFWRSTAVGQDRSEVSAPRNASLSARPNFCHSAGVMPVCCLNMRTK